jgi:cytochrome c-type biogenesis protein CcmH
VTLFLILCAVMLSVAVVLVILPLWRSSTTEPQASASKRISLMLPFVIGLPVGAVLLYSSWSNFDWNAPVGPMHGTGQAAEMEDLLGQLQERLASNPSDVEGWVMLARSYVAMGRFDQGAEAYQKAYELTNGSDPDIATGYAEALALVDENALAGRAGEIFERVLDSNPNHPKALWYGSIMALRTEQLPLARERMQRLLAQNPPDQVREVLEQQIADIAVQLGESPPTRVAEAPGQAATSPMQQAAGEAGDSAPADAGSVVVDVSIAPALAARLDGPRPLFVLARDANAPGPPLAAQRRMSNELPLVIELSDANAMIAGRTMAGAGQVEILARISQSGTPAAQSGDLVGSVNYDMNAGSGRVSVVIDQVVP